MPSFITYEDTPKNKTPSEINDVLVVYTIDKDKLVLIGIRVGSHDRLFPGQNRSKRYRKNKLIIIQSEKVDNIQDLYGFKVLLV
jgi:mRNA interferase YafQ